MKLHSKNLKNGNEISQIPDSVNIVSQLSFWLLFLLSPSLHAIDISIVTLENIARNLNIPTTNVTDLGPTRGAVFDPVTGNLLVTANSQYYSDTLREFLPGNSSRDEKRGFYEDVVKSNITHETTHRTTFLFNTAYNFSVVANDNLANFLYRTVPESVIGADYIRDINRAHNLIHADEALAYLTGAEDALNSAQESSSRGLHNQSRGIGAYANYSYGVADAMRLYVGQASELAAPAFRSNLFLTNAAPDLGGLRFSNGTLLVDIAERIGADKGYLTFTVSTNNPNVPNIEFVANRDAIGLAPYEPLTVESAMRAVHGMGTKIGELVSPEGKAALQRAFDDLGRQTNPEFGAPLAVSAASTPVVGINPTDPFVLPALLAPDFKPQIDIDPLDKSVTVFEDPYRFQPRPAPATGLSMNSVRNTFGVVATLDALLNAINSTENLRSDLENPNLSGIAKLQRLNDAADDTGTVVVMAAGGAIVIAGATFTAPATTPYIAVTGTLIAIADGASMLSRPETITNLRNAIQNGTETVALAAAVTVIAGVKGVQNTREMVEDLKQTIARLNLATPPKPPVLPVNPRPSTVIYSLNNEANGTMSTPDTRIEACDTSERICFTPISPYSDWRTQITQTANGPIDEGILTETRFNPGSEGGPGFLDTVKSWFTSFWSFFN